MHVCCSEEGNTQTDTARFLEEKNPQTPSKTKKQTTTKPEKEPFLHSTLIPQKQKKNI